MSDVPTPVSTALALPLWRPPPSVAPWWCTRPRRAARSSRRRRPRGRRPRSTRCCRRAGGSWGRPYRAAATLRPRERGPTRRCGARDGDARLLAGRVWQLARAGAHAAGAPAASACSATGWCTEGTYLSTGKSRRRAGVWPVRDAQACARRSRVESVSLLVRPRNPRFTLLYYVLREREYSE